MLRNKRGLLPILLFLVFALMVNCQNKSDLPVDFVKTEGAPVQIKDGEVVQEAMILKIGRFPRRDIDPVQASIILDNFIKPKIGDKVQFTENESGQWEKIKADSAGWFEGKKLRNAYVYVNYKVDKDQVVLLEGMGHRMVYLNGIPRIGNLYQRKDESEPWEPQYGYSFTPIKLKKGDNHLVFNASRGRLKIKFHKLRSALMINPNDPTFPDIVEGKPIDQKGAVIIINGTDTPQKMLSLISSCEKLNSTSTQLPTIPPMATRKVSFRINGKSVTNQDELNVKLKLVNKKDKPAIVDTTTVQFAVKKQNETRKNTFISDIDGSLQYYAVNPIQGQPEEEGNALVLSVHGAAVEAINQAGSYNGKDWAYIVSPTNRRPYGYDWEDWGRIDALEVLNIAKQKYPIDPNQVYLTGHSMGGHGTWYLGVTYPDKWAAIGPSAGWISFWTYVFGRYNNNTSPSEKMILRSIRPSDTYGLVDNLQNKGIYIIHGKDDQVVSIDQAHQMADTLEDHGINYEYHYEPGAGHWWDNSDEPGADCVDWPPLFDYFARHRLPDNGQMRDVNFTTANPEVSSWSHWLGILAQDEQLDLSNAKFRWNPGSGSFVGHTENVARLGLRLGHVSGHDTLSIHIDDQKLKDVPFSSDMEQIWFAKDGQGLWKRIDEPSLKLKGPHRYGTFKSAFNHRFIFVYSTQGTPEENRWSYSKARYDAETFWYQGNGAVEIIPDTLYNVEKYKDQGTILFGNSETNAAWVQLLSNSPVQVDDNSVEIGDKTIQGDNLSCFFVRPKPNSDIASVAVVSGTGIVGMRSTYNRLYMYPVHNYPDVTVFNFDDTGEQKSSVAVSGFFGLDWTLENGDFEWK